MDEFYEYWELISEFEKFEDVGKEIVKYKRNLQDPDINSRDLPQPVIDFFQHHLVNQPYPTWEILYHIIDIRNQEKNRLLEELVLNALSTLLDLISEGQLEKRDKLYCLLSNLYVSDWCMNKIYENFIPRLFDLKENKNLLDNVLFVCLLSRSTLTFLAQYMNYERQQNIEKCRTKPLFLRTCYEKVHWIETVLDAKNDEAISLCHPEVYHHLRLARLILNINKKSYKESVWWAELEGIDGEFLEPESAMSLCHVELLRQMNISKFLLPICSFNDQVFHKNLLFNQFLTLQIDFSIESYEKIRILLALNHQHNQQQFTMIQNPQILPRTEVDLLNEYMIVKLYLNILQSPEPTQQFLDSHLQHIRVLLKAINDGNVLFQLLQIVFTLLFLRFEHIRKTKRRRKNSEAQSGSFSMHNNSTDVSDTTVDTLQNGFVCLKTSLKSVLNSIRLFLMGLEQMEVYETCDEELKEKFGRFLGNVDNALWRLQIVESEIVEKSKSERSVKEWIEFYEQKAAIEVTSDEEKNSPKKKVNRKKLKKRPKNVVNSDDNDEASDDPVEYQLVTETSLDNSEVRTQSRSTESQRRLRSVISKVIMSPESLVAMCMLNGDEKNVQKVIKEYNLSDSSTAHEVSFIKNYNEAKENLRVIVERFKKLSQQRSMKTSMTKSVEINEIKNIAECGFEKAKFLNVLEKFTAKNQLKPRESDAKLLEKAVVHHPNLKMYQQNMLNVLPLVDLMISLSCPYELNHNIYKYIVKQWNFSEIEDENFGYRKFLKNLMDILTIYKNHNEDKSISDLMNDEIFTLEPAKLKKQLENRQNVLKLMDLNVSSLDDETELIEILRKFDRFEADGDFLARVISYVKNLRQLMKFQTYESFGIDELMKMDLDNVIGKIIFQQQYSPEQVENFAFNVNINLPHSMAVAAVGEFSSAKSENDEKVLSLFHMSEIGAASVEPELAMEEVREKFVVNNMDILYYIKKKGSFMVAYLVKEIQGIDYKSLKYDEPNFLARLMKISQADLYNNNPMIAALNYDHTDLKLILQKIRTASDVREKLKILRRINERQWNRNRLQFEELRDSYIEILVTSQTEDYSMLNQIGNIKKFADLLLKIFVDVKSDKDAERLLRWCLNPKNASKLDESQLCAVRNWMKKLEIYRKIALMFKSDESEDITWGKIKKLADEKPAVLANYLLNINSNMPLCLEFLNIHPLTQRSDEITKMWVEALNNRNLNENHQMMFKILETFPVKNVVEFFDFALGFINNLPSLVWVINFLTANMKTVPVVNRIRIRYQKFLISTKIFEHLEKVGDELWGLASRPLLLIEQFLMNSRLEVLRGIIYAVRGLLDSQEVCKICAATSSNMYQVGENLVYDFDTHHDDILITNECIDLLLKLYAAKALDFQIIEVHSVPSSTEVSSLDSSYGIFQMPKEIPGKDRWIPDDATSHCMCCKRQKFSLVTRRHHCRRCGRVVCSSCSQNRVEIVEIYGDLPVRVCLECHQQMISKRTAEGGGEKVKTTEEVIEWKLTGNESSDQVVRDEFNFEYSPNVGLCIAIIDLHTTNQELAKFLLFHCHRLELLLRPIGGKINPEIDIVLVAKMLKCLAFSAKIRGENGDANIIIEYADVVLKVAENGCESIAPQIPLEPINSVTIRGIINDLIKVENWKMALELSVKYDRSGTAGVFSAWGVSAIKCGQYRFAREKIDLALANILGSSTEKNEEFLKMLHGTEKIEGEKFTYKRPNRSPPLLMEVLDSLEATASRLKSTEIIKSKKESSKNVLNVMDSLRKIVEGDYGSPTRKASDKFEWSTNAAVGSSYYEESVFYLLNYGGNVEFITFLMRNNLVLPALRYVLAQQVPIDIFIQHVFVPIVKTGRLEDFVKLIKEMDASFKMWETYLVNACKYLERRRSFHCLYHMQILTGDLVRAALTCIKFYLDGSGNYTELNSKAHHLADAKIHLQMELEKTESKNVEKHEKGKKDELTLKWDLKMINAHINLISLQLEISKYMAQCEADRLPTIDLMSKIFMDKPVSVPTLFGKMQERNQVAILLLVCGHSIESGFGISYRVIQECSLKFTKVYTTCTKYLAKNLQRLMEVEKLVNSIRTNAANEENVIDAEILGVCDELVAMAVEIAHNNFQSDAKTQIDQLIKLIASKNVKVQCYINSNQLKTAFLLSAAQNNLDDIRRIMKQAEISRQENVRRLCEKKLLQRSSDTQSQGSKSDINNL